MCSSGSAGLSGLKLPEELPSPEVPERLGWLNYWSPAAAEAVGFPAPVRDADLLARARRVRGFVQLTDAPLDLDSADLMLALVHHPRAYGCWLVADRATGAWAHPGERS